MSKKFPKSVKKPRRPRNQFVALANSVNEAFMQVGADVDEMRRVIGAIVNATGCEEKVMALLGRKIVEKAVDTVVPDQSQSS